MALELEHIQGLVLFGYGNLEYSAYLFLNVGSGAYATAWLSELTPQITAAHQEKSDSAIHLALTFAGLKAFGLPADGLATFPRQFQEGMATPDRARILGDCGSSAPEQWEFGGPNTEEIHALLMLFARTAEGREALAAQQEAALEAAGLRVVHRENSERPRHNQEHFGFRDSLSQPAIAGSPAKAKPGEAILPAGEFLLGYPNAYGQIPFAPTVAASSVPLGSDANDPLRLAWGSNGTYLVFRKLQQDVGLFWDYYQTEAAAAGAKDTQAEARRLAAKSVGRWRSGASLALFPEEDSQQPNNDFGYRVSDPEGLRCPFGAHVRRANPRDMLPPGTSDESQTISHHRILRRGRPFGPCLSDPETERDSESRGLLFLALNANIRRQFEFVQQTWIGSPNFGGLYTDRDAILGTNPAATVTIPALPVRNRLCGLPQFVTMRGGGYFFLPSLPALQFLANIKLFNT